MLGDGLLSLTGDFCLPRYLYHTSYQDVFSLGATAAPGWRLAAEVETC